MRYFLSWKNITNTVFILFLCTGVLIFSEKNSMAQAKYVFLFIGDGMSLSQSNSAEMYTTALSGNTTDIKKLNFSKFPFHGITTTYSSTSLITDSAAAGTAIACGVKTYNSAIGVDNNGKKVESFAELAKKSGKRIGIVSTVSLDHATPASFYAHQKSRKNYYEIAMEMAQSDFEYFAGGGLKDPEGKKCSSSGKSVFQEFSDHGYSYINDKESFKKLKNGDKALVICPRLQDSKSMPYAIDTTPEDISLAELTAKGIEVLENPQGFFMMVESGKIDWACHANDARTAIDEVFAFSEAIDQAISFAQKHPDETLIVVTGDHETGGLTLGFSGTKYSTYFSNLQHQNTSYVAFDEKFLDWRKTHPKGTFEEIAPLVEKTFGLKICSITQKKNPGSIDLYPFEIHELRAAFARSMAGEKTQGEGKDYLLYGSYEPFTVALTHLLNQKSGIAWTSYSHTGTPVLTSAMGVNADIFSGFYDNTDIYTKFLTSLMLTDYGKK